MTEGNAKVIKEQRISYKLDQVTPVNKYEMNTYNVPFAGNDSTCRETFVKGERVLEYNISADMTFEQILVKPMFRDEMVEYMYSLSKQLVSIAQNGLNINKIVFDTRFIYVRLCDLSVQILYLPLEKEFGQVEIKEFMKELLRQVTYAHTPAIECANQIIDYFDDIKNFDVFSFNKFIKDMRDASQLLIIQDEMAKRQADEIAKYAKEESARVHAEELARNADKARMLAESEAKRQSEEAKRQAEAAKKAEDARIMAEAAKIQADVERQRAEAEAKYQAETAVLYAQQTVEQKDDEDRKNAEEAKLRAEAAVRQAEEERQRAEAEAAKLADEIRKAREAEMRAEEARMQAEYEARRKTEEARRKAEEAKRRSEEAKRLNEQRDLAYQEAVQRTMDREHAFPSQSNFRTMAGDKYTGIGDSEDATTVLSSGIGMEMNTNIPRLIRKNTGEEIYIDKQVFCIGKADQGVDYKITGNKSISRRHAYITSINGINYLRDNNSTNHTYLNGKQVYSNIDVIIPDNSIIKISNEEFAFKMA